MNPSTTLTYGLDCSVHNSLKLATRAMNQVFRSDPDMLVIFYPKPVAWMLELVRYASETGHAVLLTPDKTLAPAGTHWIAAL